ncbi:hypothetical protein DOTSEDRAFT_180769 [Dothistroma septosporum NZE10]|uniref:Alpha/beta hydrolase fold-3 domain-containing protein n=1 Tax=Dothistroma septosporum (strain NZE10 / CBS 128990) TaxID=675120 RepID=M2YIT9_DOTSN|nr:hypothetical protein DOTSEDRAFT_180769 [Dothistroma septosporum NZE10]
MALQGFQFICLRAFVNTRSLILRSSWLSPTTQPDYTKVYEGRADLFASRIFVPKSISEDSQQHRYPLVICVHGGGFIVNNPSFDDPLARYLADTVRCIAVSIDYRKAPQNKFPAAYNDIVKQSLAVINDTDLPIDLQMVVLLGSSAGGNLILAAAQHPEVRPNLTGVLALYPLCDLVPTFADKMASRPDPSVPDFLGSNYQNVAKLYLDQDEHPSFTDTRLSPTHFVDRKDLPDNVLLIGTEHDLICREAEVMAEKLANGSQQTGTEFGWRTESVQWHQVKGQPHAFDHFPAKTAEEEQERLAAKDSTYKLMCEWLKSTFARA